MEMLASGIGARSQMARTYLERHLEEFAEVGREDLIKHALRALKESLSQDKELTVENTSVGVAGIGEDFKLYEGGELIEWLETTFENKSGDSMDVDNQ
jgi:20S proteasome subunit alpha 6